MNSIKKILLKNTEHIYFTFMEDAALKARRNQVPIPSTALLRELWDAYASKVSCSHESVKIFGAALLASLVTEGGPCFDLKGHRSMLKALECDEQLRRDPSRTLGKKLTSHLPHLAFECATSTIYIRNGLHHLMESRLKTGERLGEEVDELMFKTEIAYLIYLRDHSYMLDTPRKDWPFFERSWIL